MVRIVVAGALDCNKLAHADYIAMSLSQKDPTFEYKRIAMMRKDWQTWIVEINKANGWNYYHSPIAWTEPAMWGGKAYLIGGASAFMEYCHEHFGVHTALSDEEINKWKENLLQMYMKQDEHRDCRRRKCRRITISGAANNMTPLLISELLRLPEMPMKNGIIVSLFDERITNDQLEKLENDLLGLGGGDSLFETRILRSLDQGLKRCDLMIILDRCEKFKGENRSSWLRRNSLIMKEIAKELQTHAKPTCRVVLATPGPAPLCFNASVIAEHATMLNAANIVAITADLGLEHMSALYKLEYDDRRVIQCPNVWGFTGINQWVDLNNTAMKTQLFVLNQRGEKPIPGRTLPLGTYKDVELTMRDIVSQHPTVWLDVKEQKDELEEAVKRLTYAAKVRATIDVLKCWYSDAGTNVQAGDSNDVSTKLPETSLGIASRGTFGIPKGMYFSQPVVLQDGIWKPNENAPIPNDGPGVRLTDLFTYPAQCLKYFGIGKRFNAIWLMNAEELKRLKREEDERQKIINDKERDDFIEIFLKQLVDQTLEAIDLYNKPPTSVAFSDSEKETDIDEDVEDEKTEDDEEMATEDEENTEQEEEDEDDEDD